MSSKSSLVNSSSVRSGHGSHRGSVPQSYKKAADAACVKNGAALKAENAKDVKTTLMPVFFHLLENLISNVNILVENYSNNLLSQCPNEVKQKVHECHPVEPAIARTDKKQKSSSKVMTTEKKDKEAAKDDKKDDEIEKVYLKIEPEKNSKKLAASKKRIDTALEAMLSYVHMSKDIANQTQRFEATFHPSPLDQGYDAVLRKLINQMGANEAEPQPKAEQAANQITVADLESIVYDFITYEQRQRFQQDGEPKDVEKEDLMKIQKLDRKKVEEKPLPQMIREYILHDRGNSIFLSDSFANLPSPVGEGQTVKNFFRFNEEEDNEKRLERENKERNEIKIEGKPDKKKEDKKEPEKKAFKAEVDTRQLMQDLQEIDRIVFDETVRQKKKSGDPPENKDDTQLLKQALPYTDLEETRTRINILNDQSVD